MAKTLKKLVATLRSEDVSLLDKKKQLAGEYLESYEKVEEYLKLSNIDTDERTGCMDETLDMLIGAMDKDIPVEAVIGTTPKAYCNELINSRSNKQVIFEVCKELVKIPVFAFMAVIIFALFNMVDDPFEETIRLDVAMLDLFVPIILMSVIVNVVRFSMIKKHGVYSEKYNSVSKLLLMFHFLISAFAYAVLEEVLASKKWAPKSFATTFPRCMGVAILAIVLVIIVMVFVELGGFEAIYRKKMDTDLRSRNYELMLNGFVRQYIKENNKLKKKNEREITTKDYANEILSDMSITHIALPVIIVILIIEIYVLGFFMLGIGFRWYLVIALFIIDIAVAICTSLMITGEARKNMNERIVDGQLILDGMVEYVIKREEEIAAQKAQAAESVSENEEEASDAGEDAASDEEKSDDKEGEEDNENNEEVTEDNEKVTEKQEDKEKKDKEEESKDK